MADWTQKLKLHHLQMLVALGEQGNLTQVAKMMNITQPALSKWLSQFEDEVGMVLFERHSKGLRPTEGGKLLLQHAQRLINDMSRSQYEIERFKQGGQVGSLMIGCSPVATDCVSQAILELLKEMPTLHLNIEEKVMTPLLNDLLAGVVDWLMDNKLVVGVGNIYASESLFSAGIHPDRLASSLSREECEQLVKVIKLVLLRSIEQGGTTLKDFLQSDGKPGYFAQELQVYGRKGEPCRICGTPVIGSKHAQRATFYCRQCQK